MTLTLGACPVCGVVPDPRAILCPNDGTELISPSFDPLVNTVVGSYRIIRRLGVGAMGAVYEGIETSIDKRVALKIVHPSADGSGAAAILEAKAVNAIGERGIVDIYGVGALQDGREYLVMELLVGEALDVRIRRKGQLSLQEAVEISSPLLTSLEAAHRAGFVHRDIKASNVFIVQPTQGLEFPKLLDFGIATKAAADHSIALGTPDYVAPEQAAGLSVGPAADLYAFGCLLFEMLTGHVPFPFDSSTRVLKEHRFSERPNLRFERPDLPEAVSALIVELMQVAPKDRPVSALVAREALVTAAMNAPVELATTTVGSAPRWPWAVGLLALVGIGAAVMMTHRKEASEPTRIPAVDPIEAAVLAAAAGIEAQLDAGVIEKPGDGAIDRLLGAEHAFPSRREWTALRGALTTSLTAEARRALAADKTDRALEWAAALERLEPTSTEAATLVAEARRVQFAHRHGMVRVGSVFIDAYEYPNRAKALPVSKVDWAEASRLCSEQTKHLCSEDEWVAACEGASHRRFAYGQDLVAQRCNTKETRPRRPAPMTSGTLSHCVTEEGVFDLAGNLAEWTSTPISENRPQRVIRGGSFKQPGRQSSCTQRDYLLPGLGGAIHVGFRCCL